MAEAYHPSTESKKETDEDEDKKDQKKRAVKARLGALSSHEHVSSNHSHKLDGGALRPHAVELPKRVEPELVPKDAEPKIPEVTTEAAVWPDELKKMHDEIVASVEKDEDDEEPEKPKKLAAEESIEHDELTDETELAEEDHDHIESTFQEIAARPDMAELAAMGFPERTANDAAEPAPELPTVENPDPIAHETEASDPVATHEQESGEAPVEADAGNNEPPLPPDTAERFGFGANDDNNPWEQPAGGLGNSNVLEHIDKIDKRERLNDAYHGSREAGLGAAVGLVGLGLILEHFAAKRRDKKLKRQMDAQGRQLKKTNQAVQLEQRSSQVSGRKLERIEAAQTAKSEHARNIVSAKQTAEVAAAAVVAAEQGKTHLSKAEEKVLAERLIESKELGDAIKQNPALKRSLEVASEQSIKQEQQINGLQREVSYERLRGKYADNNGPTRSGGGSSVDVHGMPVLPTPRQQLPAGVQADLMLDEHALIAKKGKTPSNVIVPVAAVTVLLILAALIVVVFAKW